MSFPSAAPEDTALSTDSAKLKRRGGKEEIEFYLCDSEAPLLAIDTARNRSGVAILTLPSHYSITSSFLKVNQLSNYAP